MAAEVEAPPTPPAPAPAGRPPWLRPRWVVGTVVAVLLVVLFVNLGFWQLHRLDERRDRNAVIESRRDLPAEPVEDVVDPGAGYEAGSDVEWRRVSAEGTYDVEGEVLVRSRSLNGGPGLWVLTPLVTDDGPALVVNRGFVPVGETAHATPAGRVEVTGLLQETQERSGIGPTDPAEGRLDDLARADVGRIQRQYDRDLYPVYLQLEEQEPAQEGELPVVLPEPDLGEGPHLSYAFQWFIFAAVGAIGWPILVRRSVSRSHV